MKKLCNLDEKIRFLGNKLLVLIYEEIDNLSRYVIYKKILNLLY